MIWRIIACLKLCLTMVSDHELAPQITGATTIAPTEKG